MGKIKLNLVSGAVVEKPLINAFKANNNSYIVLDNEMNGSMGLPIILVCKLENNRLIKIMDQGEWQIVKEYLKNIIAGNEIEFIKVNNEISADDIYYTQLTLPVPSFDALSNAYKVEDDSTNILDINTDLASEVQVAPVVEPVLPMGQEVSESEVAVPEMPINETAQMNMTTQNIDLDATMPIFGSQEQVSTPVVDTPVVSSEVSENSISDEDIFKEQKEAFMLACENMFDALVQKFQKELENRK